MKSLRVQTADSLPKIIPIFSIDCTGMEGKASPAPLRFRNEIVSKIDSCPSYEIGAEKNSKSTFFSIFLSKRNYILTK